MIDLFVIRDAGDKRGDDIVDPLIGSVAVAIARGRNELDERALPMQPVSMQVRYRDGLRLGQTVQVNDSRSGQSWAAKITGIKHRHQGVVTSTTLQLRRVPLI